MVMTMEKFDKLEDNIRAKSFELYSEARGEHVKVVELDDVIREIENLKKEVLQDDAT